MVTDMAAEEWTGEAGTTDAGTTPSTTRALTDTLLGLALTAGTATAIAAVGVDAELEAVIGLAEVTASAVTTAEGDTGRAFMTSSCTAVAVVTLLLLLSLGVDTPTRTACTGVICCAMTDAVTTEAMRG